MNRHLRYLLPALGVSALLWLGSAVLQVNATSAALGLLLFVLAVATYWGLYPAVFTSVLAMLGFNFLFLPPIGNFTVADPQNWVALFAFVITAVTASQLSASAARRAEEAMKRKLEVENLYELSRAMLLDDTKEAVKASINSTATIFGIGEITFFDQERHEISGTNPTSAAREMLESVAHTGDSLHGSGFAIIPVRFGTRIIGSLALQGGEISGELRESIASLLAINYERAKAMDRALAADAARRNETFRSSLLDGLAHDLKTPLSAVRTCVTRLITIPPRTEEVRQELLSIIDQESFRLQNTISEAIEVSRIESGKLVVERVEANLRNQVDEALSAARDEDQARYQIDIPPELTVIADSHLLQQALKQILENARKYTPAGSAVEISAMAHPETIEISISDRGPGLPPDELDLIFLKFYRGQRNHLLTEGTGVGLAVAKGIIEAHSGTIRAENLSRGGAKFTIALPRIVARLQ